MSPRTANRSSHFGGASVAPAPEEGWDAQEEEPGDIRRSKTTPLGLEPREAPEPVMRRAETTLRHSELVLTSRPRLDRLNAGKAMGSRSCNQMGELDADDCSFYLLPLPKSADAGGLKPWDDPDRAALHQELIMQLPQITTKMRSKVRKQVAEAAANIRELSQGSPETVKEVYMAGAFQHLTGLLESEDLAVVEEAVMAVYHFSQHKDATKRLIESGVMAALSIVFVRAGERQPKPHFSIQSNVCAAYLSLTGGSLKTTGSSIIFGGSSLLRSMLRLAEPMSGCNFEGRRDALKLMLLLCERGDIRTKVIDYGGVRVAVENVEAKETYLYEEVAALIYAYSKMDEAGQQLAGLMPIPEASSLSRNNAGSCRTPATPTTPQKRSGSRKTGWNIPDIAEDKELVDEAASGNENPEGEEGVLGEEPKGSRGLAAVVELLSLHCTALTQELALAAVTRLVTRGVSLMTLAVKDQPGMMEALEETQAGGSARCKKKAHALIEVLGKLSREQLLKSSEGSLLTNIRAKSCGSVQAF